MKFVVLFLFFCQVLLAQEPIHIKEFHTISGERVENNFVNKYKDNPDISVRAYVISLQMKQAKYSWSPLSKLLIFNKGKKELESLIKKYPKNIHLRYIRLLIQEEVPSILGYSKDISADKNILKSYLKKKDKTDYLDKYIKKNTTL